MEGSQPHLVVSLCEQLLGCVSSCSWGSCGGGWRPQCHLTGEMITGLTAILHALFFFFFF